jgi:hypothetical protein
MSANMLSCGVGRRRVVAEDVSFPDAARLLVFAGSWAAVSTEVDLVGRFDILNFSY